MLDLLRVLMQMAVAGWMLAVMILAVNHLSELHLSSATSGDYTLALLISSVVYSVFKSGQDHG